LNSSFDEAIMMDLLKVDNAQSYANKQILYFYKFKTSISSSSHLRCNKFWNFLWVAWVNTIP